MLKIIKEGTLLLPGILFLFVVGLISKYIGGIIPHVSYLIIAIFLGLISSNLMTLPRIIDRGIKSTHKIWLETGIVILGSRILLRDLIDIGPLLLSLILGFLIFSLLCVEFVSSRFGLEPRLGSCLASGTSVCGVSAIIATGGGINARERDMCYAIATILIFDVLTVFSYPVFAQIFSIPAQVYGVWTGISMFSTGTVVAAGFALCEEAGQLATLAKMARNSFIGIWALSYTIYYVNKGLSGARVNNKGKYLWDKFPKFVIGFLVVMVVANLGLLSEENLDSMRNMYNWLFMMAFVGLGYDMDFAELKKSGIKPFVVVLIAFMIISISVLTVSYLVFG